MDDSPDSKPDALQIWGYLLLLLCCAGFAYLLRIHAFGFDSTGWLFWKMFVATVLLAVWIVLRMIQAWIE